MTIEEAYEILKLLGWELDNDILIFRFTHHQKEKCINIYRYQIERMTTGKDLMEAIQEEFQDYYMGYYRGY